MRRLSWGRKHLLIVWGIVIRNFFFAYDDLFSILWSLIHNLWTTRRFVKLMLTKRRIRTLIKFFMVYNSIIERTLCIDILDFLINQLLIFFIYEIRPLTINISSSLHLLFLDRWVRLNCLLSSWTTLNIRSAICNSKLDRWGNLNLIQVGRVFLEAQLWWTSSLIVHLHEHLVRVKRSIHSSVSSYRAFWFVLKIYHDLWRFNRSSFLPQILINLYGCWMAGWSVWTFLR